MKRRPSPLVPVFLALLASVGFALAEEARVPITSTGVDFDYKNGITHYYGNVQVLIPDVLRLTCEDLVATQAPNTNRLDNLVATTNVVINLIRPGRTPADPPVKIEAVGDRAVFIATNNLVTLTGPLGNMPRITSPQFTTRADTVTYDLASGHMAGIGHHVTEINGDLFRNSGFFTRTNKPAQK